MQRLQLTLVLALASWCAPCLPALAADEATVSSELQSVEGGLKLSTEKQQALSASLQETARALEEMSSQLIGVTGTIQAKEALMNRIDTQLAELDQERAGIKAELQRKKAVLGEVLAGLQKLEQNPPPALVVAPDDILGALRGAMMFGAVVPEMKDEANHLIGRLERLAAITTEQADQKQTLETEFMNLQASRKELDALLASKRKLSAATEVDLQAEASRMSDLAARTKSLKQLLAALQESRMAEAARKTEEQKLKDAELARQREALTRPALHLSAAHGRLDYPVQGTILRQFGEDTATGSPLNGIAVATRAAAQVKSPVDGRVEFAGPFRSYGQLLILDAGEGYLVLLAGMATMSATAGQSIRAGEPVGTMGDRPASTTLLGGAAEDSRPVLYVEFRKQGKPVDSAPWWIGSRKEAMR